MRPDFRHILFSLLLLALLASVGPLCAATPDVRILIDVSGSMRQTDPQNLRTPALKLVNELLPAGAQAGVWLFAEKTEVLSPPGKVDDKWKARTRSRLDRIHSRGLFTDIEQAITAATVNWDKPDPDRERHLVLLTDGLVDIAPEADKNVASRARIVAEQLERLKVAQIKVHAIALSDESDEQLMRLLSRETGGWMEPAKDADALQRIFLHMLEQAAAPTTVPLEDNRFEIDDQVSEFTLLAFHDPASSEPTKLVAPGGETISATRVPEGGIWRAESGYDLVTLANPKPGRWRLKGVSDPDNRVLVVTNLGIEMAPLPNALNPGDLLHIETWLTEHKQPLIRPDLLQLLTASATLMEIVSSSAPQMAPIPEEEIAPPAAPAPSSMLPLLLDSDNGRYIGILDTGSLMPGVYQLQIIIDGVTFKRQTMKRFKIAGPPVSVRTDQQLPTATDSAAALTITLSVEPDLIDPKTLFGYLLVAGPEGRNTVLDLPAMTDASLVLNLPIEQPGEYHITGRMTAQSLTGESISFEPAPQTSVFDFAAPKTAPKPTSDSGPVSADLSWLMLGLSLFAGNLIMGLLLGLTWWWLKRSTPRPLARNTSSEKASPP